MLKNITKIPISCGAITKKIPHIVYMITKNCPFLKMTPLYIVVRIIKNYKKIFKMNIYRKPVLNFYNFFTGKHHYIYLKVYNINYSNIYNIEYMYSYIHSVTT